VSYFSRLTFESLERLTYKLSQEHLEEGQFLFKNGDDITKVYILAEGSIEVFCPLADEDIILDTLTESGCVLGQFSILDTKQCITYSARTKTESSVLVLKIEDLVTMRNEFDDLDFSIKMAYERCQEYGHPTVDYQILRSNENRLKGRQAFF
jgi:CRP-like cAMP-binding protein